MSSDTYDIEIRAIEGDMVELVCHSTGAGGVSDFACTRSFVLSVLVDAMPYNGTLPLQEGLKALGKVELWDEAFHRAHVEKFVRSVELVSRSGIVDSEGAWYAGRQNADDEDEADRDYPRHSFVLRARMTDPRWLAGLTVGTKFGTTSYDAWWNDPTRPTKEQFAAVDKAASRWKPPGAAEKVAKGGAKKVAKSGAKKVAKGGAKKVAKSGAKKVAKGGAKKVAKSGAKKVAKSGAKKVAKSGAKKVAKSGAKKVAKSGAKKVVKSGAKKVAKGGVKKVVKGGAKKVVKGGAKK